MTFSSTTILYLVFNYTHTHTHSHTHIHIHTQTHTRIQGINIVRFKCLDLVSGEMIEGTLALQSPNPTGFNLYSNIQLVSGNNNSKFDR